MAQAATALTAPLVFKRATEDWEFEQIHHLNYKTFVEEIPQHGPSSARRLVDRFHEENTYLLCLSGQRVVGMLAVRGERPFSLDQKIENLDAFLPAGRRVCEVRLLAVEPEFRGGRVLVGFMQLLERLGRERGYDLAVISGTTRQLRLYQRMGFVPFGPLVGTGEARFQPMFLTMESYRRTAPKFAVAARNFLPGPVAVSNEVRRAFERVPESHRGESFREEFRGTQRALCELVSARHAQLMMGSGTLANDVVAAQLSRESGRGLVISNGEFGERLIDHARRFGLEFDTLELEWSVPVNLDALGETRPAWLWCVHCETSTGQMCDLPALKRWCAERGVKLCVDCVSSIGTMPVDLDGVFLAACSSGKGLRAYPGVAVVFHDHEVEPAQDLPRYLDLGYYAAEQGIPFTFSSNLLNALRVAVQVDWQQQFAHTADLAKLLRAGLRERGFKLLGGSPAVITIALPPECDSHTLGKAMEQRGYLLSYNSQYLLRRNWIQVCLMSEVTRDDAESLLLALTSGLGDRVVG